MFLLDVSGDHDAYLSVQSHAFLTPKWARALGGRGGGCTADFKWGDDRRIFLGLKSSILRFLFGKANLESFFFFFGDLI